MSFPPCPFSKKGGHRIVAILPSEDAHPVVLFCEVCGHLERVVVDVPQPLDDLTEPEWVRLFKGEGT